MKKVTILLLTMSMIFSCQLFEEVEVLDTEVVLQFSIGGNDAGARIAEGIPQCQFLDSIESVFVKISGTEIWEGKLTPTYFPGIDAWQVQLPTSLAGPYVLEELIILGTADVPMYAIPHVSSAYAMFVNNPVSFNFFVERGIKEIIEVGVLCLEEHGLPDFGVDIVQLKFCGIWEVYFFANICDEFGHHEAEITGHTYLNDTVFMQGYEKNGFFTLPFSECIGDSIGLSLTIDSVEAHQYWVSMDLMHQFAGGVIHLNDNCEGWDIE